MYSTHTLGAGLLPISLDRGGVLSISGWSTLECCVGDNGGSPSAACPGLIATQGQLTSLACIDPKPGECPDTLFQSL